jgi:hypothetical protein
LADTNSSEHRESSAYKQNTQTFRRLAAACIKLKNIYAQITNEIEVIPNSHSLQPELHKLQSKEKPLTTTSLSSGASAGEKVQNITIFNRHKPQLLINLLQGI